MTLDMLDAAFLSRWNAMPSAAALPIAVDPEPPTPTEHRAVQRHRDEPGPETTPDEAPANDLVGTLLTAAPQQWRILADRVEAARKRGRRVIGIAGGEGGEGRTTLVSCLASVLRSRGRDVVCVADGEASTIMNEPLGGGAPHDKRIVLVDAGIWFPPGRIRRSRLAVATLGCDAAILVRRCGGRGGSAWEAALESLGIEVLGEVLTFVTDGTQTIGSGAGNPTRMTGGEATR